MATVSREKRTSGNPGSTRQVCRGNTVAQLIGRRCLLNCVLDGLNTEVLWDTGSQVCILPYAWLQQNFPKRKLRELSELISQEFRLKAANGSEIDYQGWVEMTFER